MVITPDNLFVFVGAGASRSVPSCRPLFNQIRDEILVQLSLSKYVADRKKEKSELVEVAHELYPEPFMLELKTKRLGVEVWLEEVLGGGEPNAAHKALASLATKGAKVWTVNFDTLIEDADEALRKSAWPEDPVDGAHVMKPHGTLGGPLIVTSEQALRGLDFAWERRLRRDVEGRIAVFLGYSGRDFDFKPLWDDVLSRAKQVIWFTSPSPDKEAEIRRLLRDVDAAGKLTISPPATPPPGVLVGSENASWDFVSWCLTEGLVSSHPDLESRLFDPPTFIYPPLKGNRKAATAGILGLLGDYRGSVKEYIGLLRGRERKDAAKSLINVVLNQAGLPMALVLGLARAVPPVGRLNRIRENSELKRLTILSKTGAHASVLRGTKNYDEKTVSTILILRSASLRFIGSLDEAADLAGEARRRELKNEHPNPVRVAHASFQRTLALLWAGRIDEAKCSLEDDLKPQARIAASRWIGWSDFILGSLAVIEGDADAALKAFKLSQVRFETERLVDGLVSVAVAELALRRLQGKEDEFRNEVVAVEDLFAKSEKGQTFYARAHQFTMESIALERAEFARVHERNLTQALNAYKDVANSRYPLHRAHALVGVSLVELEKGQPLTRACDALAVAEKCGSRFFVELTKQILAAPAGACLPEIFFG